MYFEVTLGRHFDVALGSHFEVTLGVQFEVAFLIWGLSASKDLQREE